MNLASRPEARWALGAGIGGGFAAIALSVKSILAAGPGAALGFVVVPFVAIAVAVPSALWGLALGCVWLHLRGRQQYFRAVLALAWILAVALPAALAAEVWRGLELQRAVRAAQDMGAAELEAAFERSPWRENRFFLGALAGHPAAPAGLLDRIARIDDADLYERMGSIWNVLGANRGGVAVMRLVAQHDNVAAQTLERLAGAAPVLPDVLGNARTPMSVLARHLDSTAPEIESELARNPNTPLTVLERHARSGNRDTRLNLTRNAAVPITLLRRLARDPDRGVARNALQAIARRHRAR